MLTTRPSSTAAVWCQRCLSSGAGEPAGKLKAAATDLPPLALTPPTEPGPEDCCQTGCVECVWDVYQRELHAYNLQQAKLKGEAPPLDPFEEMERRLFGK